MAWATMGRDPGNAADASVVKALPHEAVESSELISESKVGTTHAVATPFPVKLAEPSFSQATETQAVEPQVASPVVATKPTKASEPFKPMVALPEPGAAFPPVMPVDPKDDPHYGFGGLYGTPGATRLVYLIDASGSLIDTFPFILEELRRSIQDLRPEQSFAVLFFSGNEVTEAPPYGMKRASGQAVEHTSQWIAPSAGRIIASGRPHADAAIRRALAYQPDAIILLSDGLTGTGDKALAKRARLLSLIGTANTRDVVFHTLQVRRPDPLSTPTRLGTLELIALQSGGVHRYLGEDDLLPE
ncbi:MAG: vWA domain-containing protein [Planctomycetota bacterium]